MTEPLTTNVYGLPRQVAGQLSRVRMNAALDGTDALFAALAGQVAQQDQERIRYKPHPLYTMAAGETVLELAEAYQTGALWVARGRIPMIPGLDFTEVDATHIAFTTPALAGEPVQVIEFQRGPDAGALPPLPVGPTYTVTETPLGAVDSTDGFDGNGTFTLSKPIADGTTPHVRVGGFIELTPLTEFTWAGATIEILPGSKPIPGETPEVEYQWRYE